MKKMLILGGNGFLGSAFTSHAMKQGEFLITLANRGQTNRGCFPDLDHLLVDRNSFRSCAQAFANRKFDFVVDFSCSAPVHLESILANCEFDAYTFVSSSAVDLSWSNDELFEMAKNKLWCEHKIRNTTDVWQIVRPGYVVGPGDSSARFEQMGPYWYWQGTNELVNPCIEVGFLARTMYYFVSNRHVGIIRAGY